MEMFMNNLFLQNQVLYMNKMDLSTGIIKLFSLNLMWRKSNGTSSTQGAKVL